MTDWFRYDGNDGLPITDGVNWKPVAETRYHHKKSRLATYEVDFQPTHLPTKSQMKCDMIIKNFSRENHSLLVLEVTTTTNIPKFSKTVHGQNWEIILTDHTCKVVSQPTQQPPQQLPPTLSVVMNTPSLVDWHSKLLQNMKMIHGQRSEVQLVVWLQRDMVTMQSGLRTNFSSLEVTKLSKLGLVLSTLRFDVQQDRLIFIVYFWRTKDRPLSEQHSVIHVSHPQNCRFWKI